MNHCQCQISLGGDRIAAAVAAAAGPSCTRSASRQPSAITTPLCARTRTSRSPWPYFSRTPRAPGEYLPRSAAIVFFLFWFFGFFFLILFDNNRTHEYIYIRIYINVRVLLLSSLCNGEENGVFPAVRHVYELLGDGKRPQLHSWQTISVVLLQKKKTTQRFVRFTFYSNRKRLNVGLSEWILLVLHFHSVSHLRTKKKLIFPKPVDDLWWTVVELFVEIDRFDS